MRSHLDSPVGNVAHHKGGRQRRPDAIWVKVPPPLPPVMVIWYWSVGLSPGGAAFHDAASVSLAEPSAVQPALTPVGAPGGVALAWVVTEAGAPGGLDLLHPC